MSVLSLCHTLPTTENETFVIFIDNFYTTVQLFRLLREELGISACGTIRNGPGKEILKEILALEDPISQRAYRKTIVGSDGKRRKNPNPPSPLTEREKAQLEWGWVEEVVLPGKVLVSAWRDNTIVYLASTIHPPASTDEDFVDTDRRRPKNPTPSVANAFEEYVKRILPIPKLIDDYNNNMNGVDVADQLRTYMTTHKKGRRVWFPIFWWLLDSTAGNAYILYSMHAEELRTSYGTTGKEKEVSHREWMEHAAFGMIADGFQKLNGHTSKDSNFTDTTELLNRVKKYWGRSRHSVTIIERLLSKVWILYNKFFFQLLTNL